MDKISIIVPVYNVEKYLERCVESLMAQTFSNIEILLIDDGSKDNSGHICDEFSKKDDRIRVFHKSNGGLSDARNVGIDNAMGDYICFVDSDDYVADDYCEKMINVAKKEDADIVICKYERFEGEKCQSNISNSDDYTVYDRVEALKNLYSFDGEAYTLAWNKLYKRSVIGNTRYPVGYVNEDEFTTYKYILNASKIIMMDAVLYFYFRNNNSITTNKKYLENMDIFAALDERKQILLKQENMSEIIKLHNKTYLNRIIFRNRDLRKVNRSKYKELLETYRSYYKDVKDDVKGIGYLIYYVCPGLYYRLV